MWNSILCRTYSIAHLYIFKLPDISFTYYSAHFCITLELVFTHNAEYRVELHIKRKSLYTISNCSHRFCIYAFPWKSARNTQQSLKLHRNMKEYVCKTFYPWIRKFFAADKMRSILVSIFNILNSKQILPMCFSLI